MTESELQELICKINNGDIKNHLNLVKREIDDEQLQLILSGLSYNNTIFEVDLACNNITTEGCKHIAKFLQDNNCVQTLILDFNKIGTEGMHSICESLSRRNVDKQSIWLRSYQTYTPLPGEFEKYLINNPRILKLDISTKNSNNDINLRKLEEINHRVMNFINPPKYSVPNYNKDNFYLTECNKLSIKYPDNPYLLLRQGLLAKYTASGNSHTRFKYCFKVFRKLLELVITSPPEDELLAPERIGKYLASAYIKKVDIELKLKMLKDPLAGDYKENIESLKDILPQSNDGFSKQIRDGFEKLQHYILSKIAPPHKYREIVAAKNAEKFLAAGLIDNYPANIAENKKANNALEDNYSQNSDNRAEEDNEKPDSGDRNSLRKFHVSQLMNNVTSKVLGKKILDKNCNPINEERETSINTAERDNTTGEENSLPVNGRQASATLEECIVTTNKSFAETKPFLRVLSEDNSESASEDTSKTKYSSGAMEAAEKDVETNLEISGEQPQETSEINEA